MQAALALCMLACLLVPGVVASAQSPRSSVELVLRYPDAEAVLSSEEPVLLVGDAFVDHGATGALDVAIVVDVSSSTGVFAGADVDGDGVEEERSFGGDDSVLAVERLAVERVLDALGGHGRRMALVAFSARSTQWWRDEPAARVVHPLTEDPSRLRGALGELAGRRPQGLTDLAAALREGLRALGPEAGERDRVMLLFTDGSPTRPFDTPAENVRAALEAAEECARQGVRVHAFAVGTKALANPAALIRVAETTRGLFTPVAEPADLPEVARWVARSTLRDVRVRNLRTGEPALRTRSGHDASWSALVSLAPGENEIEIVASAAGHEPARRRITLLARPGAEGQSPPKSLGDHRALLLEDRLARERRRVESLRERLREKLVREMERVRSRKEVDLRAEERAASGEGSREGSREGSP